ncbi:MAG: helix-turn-helix domain-containing protein [Gilliamella sp.]|nr:helix-turn-helix domain-containing protein [Gilliamella sp.]MCO6554101.1 helix-turn-helix domain-containing protein [Gilliamella sp.]
METIGQRIKKLRKDNKKTQLEVGKFCNVSDVTVGFWERDVNEPKGRALQLLAKLFNVDVNYILYGSLYNIAPVKSSTVQSVPLLSTVQAGNFTEHIIPDSEIDKWIDTTFSISSESFALKVVGDSMLNPFGNPSIPEGSIIIVDTQKSADNGKIVVARIEGTNEVTVKKLVIDGPNKYLMPLNPQYKSIPISNTCLIIGVVKGVQIEL